MVPSASEALSSSGEVMPQRLRRLDHRGDAHFLRQIRGDGVDRMRQRVGQRHGAVVAAAEIGRRASR